MKTRNFLGIFLLSSIIFISGYQQLQAQAQFVDDVENSTLDSPNNLTQTLTKDELYFGLSKQQGQITETEWQDFLENVITPRFTAGLTVLDAKGQYLNAAGILIREPTKLVILIHANGPKEQQFIQEIITEYKKRFDQESVLRVTSSVTVSF